ncbi:hypothetical protein chiPu_0031935, partial [Chiloscyllium punctatum]|nr:hypothetical protein [Chiloscyllium punctatum]
QDHHEGRKRDHGAQQSDPERQGLFDETLGVVGDTLVRVVGGITEQLHAIVVGIVQPAAEIARGHPASPADLQPLIEVELVDFQADPERREHAEIADLIAEDRLIALLQRVVENIVPAVEQHGEKDAGELDDDHRRQQATAGPFVLGVEIGRGDAPHRRERRANVFHRLSSPGKRPQRPEESGQSAWASTKVVSLACKRWLVPAIE